MSHLIKAHQLSKHYGKFQALNGLNMQVQEGEVYGLLGRNGMGKTTTLRLIFDLLRPSSGHLEVMGHTPQHLPLALRQQMGYSSDSMRLIPWLRVSEMLSCNGAFYPNWDAAYVKTWLDRLSLDPHKRVFSLSRGDRQKLALILAIGHRPRLLVLDEPAGGLDPLARREFLESMIELIHEAGTTIVLSSHQMSDLERIADRVGLIVDGRMRLESSLEDLKASCRRVHLYSDDNTIALATLADWPGVVHLNARRGLLELVVENWSAAEEKKLLQVLPNTRLEQSALSLEEIFLIYTSTLTAGGAACPAK